MDLKDIKKWYHNKRLMKKQSVNRERLLACLEKEPIDSERRELIPFFKEHCFEAIPYSWVDDTKAIDIEVHYDDQFSLPYVIWHGKKLYWKSNTRPQTIQKCIWALQVEQDDRSPHKYVITEDIDGGVLADLGTAEGIFTLDVIERVKHAYLFECDPEWVSALQATFMPWKNKVTIVSKFVGNCNDDKCVTLDNFFSDKELDYVKADIEGAEIDMLLGGESSFRSKIKAANICLYHRSTDAERIHGLLASYGYKCQVNDGYILIVNEQEMPLDWLRRGVTLARRER